MSAAAAFYSRYAPETEAERYAQAMLADKKPALIFILGAGRNYLGAACRKLSPGARIVLLQPCAGFEGELVDVPDRAWHPGLGLSLEGLIAASLDDGKAAGGIAVLEWRPIMNAFPQEAAAMQDALASALERYSSAAATSSYWSRRWLRNSVRFALKARRFARIRRGAGPLLLACAGPSLERSLEAIKATDIPIWALSSAQEALQWRGLRPSLVLSSDPGPWASLHLRAALSGACPLALPPSAALPAALLEGGAAIAALDTGMAFEALALGAAGAEALSARSSGTAAGTALSLALAACDGKVYILGQDLAASGLSAHARPYALDRIDFERPSRLEPELHQRSAAGYERYGIRIGDWRLSRAFNAYAKDAFLSSGERDRCLRISDSPVDNELAKLSPGSFLADPRREGPRPGVGQGRTAAPQAGPRIEEYESPFGMRERAERMAHALEREGERLDALISGGVSAGRSPLSADDAASLLAFSGKAAAPYIAEAARGRVEADSVQLARAGLERGKAALLEFCNA